MPDEPRGRRTTGPRIVVTTRTHASRTQLIMNRCVPEGMNVVGLNYNGPSYDIQRSVYEGGTFFKAFSVTNTC